MILMVGSWAYDWPVVWEPPASQLPPCPLDLIDVDSHLPHRMAVYLVMASSCVCALLCAGILWRGARVLGHGWPTSAAMLAGDRHEGLIVACRWEQEGRRRFGCDGCSGMLHSSPSVGWSSRLYCGF